MGEMINASSISVAKPEVKRPFGRPRRRWEENIRIDLREIRWEVMDWIDLVQDRADKFMLVYIRYLEVDHNS
jgi:hypothetical protein